MSSLSVLPFAIAYPAVTRRLEDVSHDDAIDGEAATAALESGFSVDFAYAEAPLGASGCFESR